LVRLRSELVLLRSGELIDIVALLGQGAHRLVGENVVQAVVGHVVEHRDVAVFVARSAVHQEVWCLGHRLLPAGHDHIELAGPDQLIGQCNGIYAGQTHLVDGQRRHIPADTGGDRGLPRWHLPSAGGQNLAHDHVLHQRRRDTGFLQRTGDGDGTQIAAREILQRTHQFADRRAGSSNDHRRRHSYLQRVF
jgi:hypothetical protein